MFPLDVLVLGFHRGQYAIGRLRRFSELLALEGTYLRDLSFNDKPRHLLPLVLLVPLAVEAGLPKQYSWATRPDQLTGSRGETKRTGTWFNGGNWLSPDPPTLTRAVRFRDCSRGTADCSELPLGVKSRPFFVASQHRNSA